MLSHWTLFTLQIPFCFFTHKNAQYVKLGNIKTKIQIKVLDKIMIKMALKEIVLKTFEEKNSLLVLSSLEVSGVCFFTIYLLCSVCIYLLVQ